MIRTDPRDLIDIGTRIERLRRATADWRIHKKGGARPCARVLGDLLKKYEFTTTRDSMKRESGDLFKRLKQRPTNERLKAEEALALTKIFAHIHGTLVPEAGQKAIFLPEPTRLGTANLLDHPDKLFGQGVFRKLPDMAQRDFAEAGVCIAFGCSTAAACLLMRGTEAVLTELYLAHVKQSVLPEKDRVWGKMLCELRDRQKPPKAPAKKLPEPLLDDLHFIKKNFRNPTQHPCLSYDSDMVQDLFFRCIPAVNEMAKHLVP